MVGINLLIYCQFEKLKQTIAILLWQRRDRIFCYRVLHYCDFKTIQLNCWIRYFCSKFCTFVFYVSRARVPNANCRDNYIAHVMCKNKTNQLSMIDEACRFIRGIPKVVCHLCHLWLLTNNNKCHILLAVETKTTQIQSQTQTKMLVSLVNLC